MFEGGSGKTIEERQGSDRAAVSRHIGCADDPVLFPIPTFDQNIRTDDPDEFERRIFVEYGNSIDERQTGQYDGPCEFGLNRSEIPFQSSDGRIPVQADDQLISQVPGLGQVADMAGMKQIEATVGKDDTEFQLSPGV